MPKEVTVQQEDIVVEGKLFTVTRIPTATSGCWFTVHDACDVWGAVAIELDGTVIGWRNPPQEEYRKELEEAIKKAFAIEES